MLGNRQRYLDELDRLHLKYTKRNKLYDVSQDDVSFTTIFLNRSAYANLLASEVREGRYRLRDAEPRMMCVREKERLLYCFCLSDRIVHGVVSRVIGDCIEPILSPRLYSYRSGTQWWHALADFSKYIRAHCRTTKDPRQRGLYVLRRDVSKYADSIPVDDASEIWRRIADALPGGIDRDPLGARHWKLIRDIVRPSLRDRSGRVWRNERGVPTGSPISTALFNLYLMPLDEELSAIPGGFYARYSDDFLFAHPDPDVVRSVAPRIRAILADRQLHTNESKHQDLFFNRPGRPSPAWPELRGTSVVPFLGCNVFFDGTVALAGKKVKRLQADLAARIRRTMALLQDRPADEAGPTVCGVVNRALDPSSPGRQKYAPLLRRVVTNRGQLAELDHTIARTVAETVSGRSGVRAFRNVPYRQIRQDWGLVSLLHARNRADREQAHCRAGT